MTSDNSTAIHSAGDADFNTGYEPYQVLEVQMMFYTRMIDEFSGLILQETGPIPIQTALFKLPLYEQIDDPVFLQIYIVDLLSSLPIAAAASEIIAGQIATSILRITGENRNANFHVTAVVDNIFLYTYTPPWLDVETDDETPESVERFRMEKLEENDEDELGICCICLDEINCKKCDAVRIPCGHVYHKPCVSTWLHNSDSCPLCRRSVSLKEDSY